MSKTKAFTIKLKPDMQTAMRSLRRTHGINWGFYVREAIKIKLDSVKRTKSV